MYSDKRRTIVTRNIVIGFYEIHLRVSVSDITKTDHWNNETTIKCLLCYDKGFKHFKQCKCRFVLPSSMPHIEQWNHRRSFGNIHYLHQIMNWWDKRGSLNTGVSFSHLHTSMQSNTSLIMIHTYGIMHSHSHAKQVFTILKRCDTYHDNKYNAIEVIKYFTRLPTFINAL